MAMQHGSYQNPLVCHGHSRPIVELDYSRMTEDGVFLISASKGVSLDALPACLLERWAAQLREVGCGQRTCEPPLERLRRCLQRGDGRSSRA